LFGVQTTSVTLYCTFSDMLIKTVDILEHTKNTSKNYGLYIILGCQ